ncbi:type 1 glutamine amidotransferase [Massilia sp. BJB1822]|uniref:type 1 glutamine amidotransferase n=1 Tax=Massilia sp. BJB1822 TaxID=2744470 RepID=UPI0015934C53|nr:type 1 glutamine amidotransferase [Massilia sp. BJB1822]NVD96683.1 type 1 glutamine amidotransferase [Massilia sp. BJB1822]
MHIHFVVHESFEAPGAYETWVKTRAYTASYSRVYAGEPLPQTVDAIDLLVVLGGPQSPATTRQECPHFDSAAEQALIVKCANAGKAVVGVCLGAQLIGAALGAPSEPSPEKEIGNFPIALTAAGKANAKFAHFGDTLETGHWHSDMPGLTPAATVIAASEGCPRQIIAYRDLVYGFQCHMEFTPEAVELLIAASEAELATLTAHRYVQQPAALRVNSYAAMNQKLFVFLDSLMREYAN